MGGEKSLCVCFNCESASFEIVSRVGGVFQERERLQFYEGLYWRVVFCLFHCCVCIRVVFLKNNTLYRISTFKGCTTCSLCCEQ